MNRKIQMLMLMIVLACGGMLISGCGGGSSSDKTDDKGPSVKLIFRPLPVDNTDDNEDKAPAAVISIDKTDYIKNKAPAAVITIDKTDDIENKVPAAVITGPADNSTFTYGDSVAFAGTGTDPEDGDLPAAAFEWSSSIDGPIHSESKTFSIRTLSLGTHTITLMATDSDGASGMAAIDLTINADPSIDQAYCCISCELDFHNINRGGETNATAVAAAVPCHPFDYEDFGICAHAGDEFFPSFCQDPENPLDLKRAVFEPCLCYPGLQVGDHLRISMEIVVNKGESFVAGDNGVYWAENVETTGIGVQVFDNKSDARMETGCAPAGRFSGSYVYRRAGGDIGSPYDGPVCAVADHHRVVKIEPVSGDNAGLELTEPGKCSFWIDIPRMRVDPARILPGWDIWVKVCLDDFFENAFQNDCCCLIYIGRLGCEGEGSSDR